MHALCHTGIAILHGMHLKTTHVYYSYCLCFFGAKEHGSSLLYKLATSLLALFEMGLILKLLPGRGKFELMSQILHF